MSDSRRVDVQYCDDVRQEIGNKYSLMGCYGSDMYLAEIPAVLPKLCAQIRIQTTKDSPFAKVVVRAEFNEEVISEIELPPEHLSESQASLDLDDDTRSIVLMVIMSFSPLAVPEPGKLRIKVETEEGIVEGSTLKLQKNVPTEESSQAE